jgi:hypothetical protein
MPLRTAIGCTSREERGHFGLSNQARERKLTIWASARERAPS